MECTEYNDLIFSLFQNEKCMCANYVIKYGTFADSLFTPLHSL
jgi:hypothetical protein